ncbi:hypothetical protein RclHR1_01570004 [Rhizophagus clarus]|uniref:Granulins domain-containing protein n=1 Tax=Rhizophagus clarus TaxID=94130 RepID=A0A2Z6QJX3_9GLOM|nr:hypothetical protein RclHR1_01570004 [Rhizophagus clarus]GES80892.1 hypothetical protein GLOIN_2v1704946 [Rhizophagus clarus]
MKNLILILVLAVVAFSTIAPATPTNWKRDVAFRLATIPAGKPTSTSLMKRQQYQCDPLNDVPCGIGCCPTGSNCLISIYQCDIPCTVADIPCGNNGGCCLPTNTCVAAPNGQYVCN